MRFFMRYTIVMTIRYNSNWLSLARSERNEFNEKNIFPILNKFSKFVNVKFFDAECFYARGSDFIIFECDDLQKYYFLVEDLRDTELFSKEYLTIIDIMMGLEDGYKEFESTSEQ